MFASRISTGKLASQPADLGSMISPIGANAVKDFAGMAETYERNATYGRRRRRRNTIRVNGVGAGSAPCDVDVDAPIAVHFAGGARQGDPGQCLGAHCREQRR